MSMPSARAAGRPGHRSGSAGPLGSQDLSPLPLGVLLPASREPGEEAAGTGVPAEAALGSGGRSPPGGDCARCRRRRSRGGPRGPLLLAAGWPPGFGSRRRRDGTAALAPASGTHLRECGVLVLSDHLGTLFCPCLFVSCPETAALQLDYLPVVTSTALSMDDRRTLSGVGIGR